MARVDLLKQLFRPTAIRIGSFVIIILPLYDVISNQFGLPKLGSFIGVRSIPPWAYISALEGLLLWALFEVVFHLQPTVTAPSEMAILTPDAVPEPEPDIALSDVALRVQAANDREMTYQEINRAIADRVKLSGLKVWGRLGDAAITVISGWQLERAAFILTRNEVQISNGWSATVYTDVKFVEIEIEEFWPPAA